MSNSIIQKIAKKEFELFVVNTCAAGIQQKDGRYVTKYIPVSEFVIENMILQNGSMGCYQQGYKTNHIKWICIDFDCKDKENPDIFNMYNKIVKPFTCMLDRFAINYLTEFSGRRGIHVWIHFDRLISKEIGFSIVLELEKRCPEIFELENMWGIDRFPATASSKNNIVGKQVKFPLSCHKNGSRSYFFVGEYKKKTDTKSRRFMQEQLDILDKYQVNKIENVLNKLGMEYNVSEILNIKYKKYAILGRVEVTTEKVVDILSEVVVYKELFNRMEKGIAKHQDWLVLLGTLAPCDADASLLKSVLQRFPNYDEEKTLKNVEILKDKYFPATFRYLYQIYKLDMEKGINPNETGLLYLLKRIGMEQSIIEQYEAFNEIQSLSNINVTIDKEKNYLKENDEVPNVIEWNYLNTLKLYDLQYFQEEFEDIVYGNKKKPELAKYDIYYRVESVSKIRELVSLSGKDRVITTHLALKLCDLLKGNWKSYSYHVSLISKDQIFYSWYSSWGRFIDQLRVFFELPFMDNYNVFYIDLKGFYDHIDFLTVYRTFEKEFDEEAKNIFEYLVEYNNLLMRTIHEGNRLGVPQGPAYARIIAELFLDKVLEVAYKKFENEKFYAYRYVDDLVFFCTPDFDDKLLYEEIKNTMYLYGLPINEEKSRYFGKISQLSKDDKSILLHSDSFNYDLQENEQNGAFFEADRKDKLRKYLLDCPFNIGTLGYIFSRKTIEDAQEWCVEHYRREIISSIEGRGSNFRRFYDVILSTPKYLEQILDNNDFEEFNVTSLNFSNFVSVLYFFVQERKINPELFRRIKNELFEKVDLKKVGKKDNDIINALKMINLEEDNE